MTLQELWDIRASGNRPNGLLNIGIGGYPFADYDLWFPGMPEDVRALAGLDVWVTSERYPLRDVERELRECRTLIVTAPDGYRCSKLLGENYAAGA